MHEKQFRPQTYEVLSILEKYSEYIWLWKSLSIESQTTEVK